MDTADHQTITRRVSNLQKFKIKHILFLMFLFSASFLTIIYLVIPILSFNDAVAPDEASQPSLSNLHNHALRWDFSNGTFASFFLLTPGLLVSAYFWLAKQRLKGDNNEGIGINVTLFIILSTSLINTVTISAIISNASRGEWDIALMLLILLFLLVALTLAVSTQVFRPIINVRNDLEHTTQQAFQEAQCINTTFPNASKYMAAMAAIQNRAQTKPQSFLTELDSDNGRKAKYKFPKYRYLYYIVPLLSTTLILSALAKALDISEYSFVSLIIIFQMQTISGIIYSWLNSPWFPKLFRTISFGLVLFTLCLFLYFLCTISPERKSSILIYGAAIAMVSALSVWIPKVGIKSFAMNTRAKHLLVSYHRNMIDLTSIRLHESFSSTYHRGSALNRVVNWFTNKVDS